MSRQIRLSQGFPSPAFILSLLSNIWSFLTASGLKKSAVLKSCPNSAEAQSAAGEIGNIVICTINMAHGAERDSSA